LGGTHRLFGHYSGTYEIAIWAVVSSSPLANVNWADASITWPGGMLGELPVGLLGARSCICAAIAEEANSEKLLKTCSMNKLLWVKTNARHHAVPGVESY